MKFILNLFIICSSFLGYSQYGLDSVIVEQIDASSVMENAITYRVFVDLEQGYRLAHIWGDQECPLIYCTTETWFNSEYGGATNSINSFLFPLYPELAYDSYVSLGGASNTEWGVLYEDDSDGTVDGRIFLKSEMVPMVSTLGDSITVELQENFTELFSQNCFVDDIDDQFFTLTNFVDVTPHNRILIGQFTTAGVFSFSLNLFLWSEELNMGQSLSWCDYPSLNYPVPVGIDHLSRDASNLVLYPNPAQNKLLVNFHLKDGGPIGIELLDYTGKLIEQTVSTFLAGEITHSLDIESLEPGIYFIKISDIKNTIAQRFSVVR